MNIPNVLTIFRFLLIPVFIYAYFSFGENGLYYAVAVFLLAGFTDVLDGYIARKYNMITKWGKILDPTADKAMQLAVLACLCVSGIIPLWAACIILVKELLMAIGGITLYKKNIVISSSWYGKLATVIFYFVVILVIFFNKIIRLENVFIYNLLYLLAVLSSLFALFSYARQYMKVYKGNSE